MLSCIDPHTRSASTGCRLASVFCLLGKRVCQGHLLVSCSVGISDAHESANFLLVGREAVCYYARQRKTRNANKHAGFERF